MKVKRSKFVRKETNEWKILVMMGLVFAGCIFFIWSMNYNEYKNPILSLIIMLVSGYGLSIGGLMVINHIEKKNELKRKI